MKSLTDQEITELTKGIIKHCIIPQLTNFFTYPSFEHFHKAAECLPNYEEVLKVWLDENNKEIDGQISKIYRDIEESIVEGLNGFN